MMPRIRHTSRAAAFVTTAFAALVATTHFAEAKKPKPAAAILAVTAAATTTNIEGIAALGIPAGDQLAAGTIKLNPLNVNTLVKGLTDAILAKPSPASQTDPLDPNFVNRDDNKEDEIGEVAAFVMNALAANTKVQKAKDGAKYAVYIMKTALKNALKNPGVLGQNLIADVVGSVALTIHNDVRFDAQEGKIAKALGKKAQTIAGKKNKNAVKAALTAGFAGGATLEDGNDDSLTLIIDPETDFRNA
jgi:hypothetical protein